jgi:hypothetical protein
MIFSLDLRYQRFILLSVEILTTTPGKSPLHHPAHNQHHTYHYQDADQYSTGEKDEWHSKERHHKRHNKSTQFNFSETVPNISTTIEMGVEIFKNMHFREI